MVAMKRIMGCLAVCLLILFPSGCTDTSRSVPSCDQDVVPGKGGAYAGTEQNSLYNYEQIYTYKNISSQDMNKLQMLVSHLQYARELPLSRIEYEENSTLRIDYGLNLKPGQSYQVNHQKMMADAIVLLAVIDDLNAVEFNLTQARYGYGGVPITREEAGQVLGADIKSLGKDRETFLTAMPRKIIDLKWNPEVMNVITYEHIMS
jgi:hypothetical protein